MISISCVRDIVKAVHELDNHHPDKENNFTAQIMVDQFNGPPHM